MSFDWWTTTVPESVTSRGPAARRAMHATEVRARAGLLMRLGHEQSYAVHRCLGNLAWGFELRGTPPLGADEVRALVAETYGRRNAK